MEEKQAATFVFWGAPVKMGLALLLGLGFMIGHYCFYHSLNHQPTPDAGYNIWGDSFNVSGQQINIAIGSLFALLVKTTLGFAVTTALEQVIWKQIREEPTRVGVIDDVLSIPTAVFSLANPGLWRRYPLAVLAGVILWLLPIISVITPATLTVRSTPNIQTEPAQVPRIDFASVKLASFGSSENGYFYYGSPQLEVQTIAESVATGAEILPVTPPFPNSSWSLEFHGPALNCQDIDQTSRTEILHSVQVNNNCSDGTVYGYLAWTPLSYDFQGQSHQVTVPPTITPFDKHHSDLLTGTLGPTDATNRIPLTLYVAALPEMLKRPYVYAYKAADNCPTASTFVANATVIECTLKNASYSANFTFLNGAQTVDFTRGEYLNNVTYMDHIYGGDLSNFEARLGQITQLETLSYQAMLDSLDRLLVGAIGLAQTLVPAGDMAAPTVTHGLNTTNTDVLSTIVGSAKELAFLANYTDENGPTDPYGGLAAASDPAGRGLSSIIERVFENITISMMSADSVQYNYSSPLAPDNVPVTTTRMANLYLFSKSVLLIAYGIALLLALCVVGLGLFAYVASRGSYSSRFSTILRTTRRAQLSTSIDVTDESGQDPLPKHIAASTIALAGQSADDAVPEGPRRRYQPVQRNESEAASLEP